MMRITRKPAKGFTLIELLIVVAIIAILAAIAVPNFLEAQVRSKVSRAQSDMRAIATACEAYRVDTNTYPHRQDNEPDSRSEDGYRVLTTPVAYLSSIPRDSFTHPGSAVGTNFRTSPFYEMASGVDMKRRRNLPDVQAYMIKCNGPDNDQDGTNDHWPYAGSDYKFYDPTNGTRSRGDILRFGGNYMGSPLTWTAHGLPHQNWGIIPVTMPSR